MTTEAELFAPEWWTEPDAAPFEPWSADDDEEDEDDDERDEWEQREVFELELLEAVQDLGTNPETGDADDDEIEYEAELDEAGDLLVARYAWAPVEETTGAGPQEVIYPSGARLRVVSAPDGPGEEYHDPNASGDPARDVPLVDTSGANKSVRLSKNFTVGEIARSGRVTYDMARIDPRLVSCLQALRDRTGRPVRVNSGYRSYLYNVEVYRRDERTRRRPTNSQHSSGKAADVRVPGLTGMQIAQAAIDACGCELGVGIANTYAHIDVRSRFARWSYFGAGTPADRAATSTITAYRRGRCGAGTEAEASEAESVSIIGRVREALVRGAWSAAVGLAASAGITDPNKLTNLVFFFRHPDLRGRPIRPDERDLAAEWRTIRDTIVRPVLDRPGSGGDFRRVKNGYARYGGGRVDDRLRALRTQGRQSVDDDEIDMLQRIANVESSGQIQGVNSWDNMFMSFGFMQWTIGWGKLQRFIRTVPAAFARFGIEVEPSRTYTLVRAGKSRQEPAIVGAPRGADLRSLAWAQRFWSAGLDDEIIIAEVAFARGELGDARQRIERKVGSGFLQYYRQSPVVRAFIHETHNNRPTYLYAALEDAMDQAGRGAGVERFLQLLHAATIRVYQAREKDGKGAAKARRLVDKTARLVL